MTQTCSDTVACLDLFVSPVDSQPGNLPLAGSASLSHLHFNANLCPSLSSVLSERQAESLRLLPTHVTTQHSQLPQIPVDINAHTSANATSEEVCKWEESKDPAFEECAN